MTSMRVYLLSRYFLTALDSPKIERIDKDATMKPIIVKQKAVTIVATVCGASGRMIAQPLGNILVIPKSSSAGRWPSKIQINWVIHTCDVGIFSELI